MICSSFVSAAIIGSIAFLAGAWARSRFTPHALEPRPWWVPALYGSGCAIVAVATLYLPEAYAALGGAAVTLLFPALAGAASLRTPRRLVDRRRGVAR